MKIKNPCCYVLESIYRNIEYFKSMIKISNCMRQRVFFENQLYMEIIHFNNWKRFYDWCKKCNERQRQEISEKDSTEKRVFTVEELAGYDGSHGRPAYVAVNGIVFDVSLEATWGGGTHFSLYSGKDLTAEFNGCNKGKLEMLKKLPIVGILM